MVALAAAVAVVETLAPLLPDHQVGLHWPNDVFVGQRKLAGILIEVLPGGRHVVGIGINTNNTLADAPPTLRQQAATLFDLTGRRQDQTAILIALVQLWNGPSPLWRRTVRKSPPGQTRCVYSTAGRSASSRAAAR